MLRKIIFWGMLLGGCIATPCSLGATSLDWQEGLKQMHADKVSLQYSALVSTSASNERLVGQITAQAIVSPNAFQKGTATTVPSSVPTFALPESGTLILLGIGLASIASLIRRKKDSS